MEHPKDFPKALAVSMAAEFCLFTITVSFQSPRSFSLVKLIPL